MVFAWWTEKYPILRVLSFDVYTQWESFRTTKYIWLDFFSFCLHTSKQNLCNCYISLPNYHGWLTLVVIIVVIIMVDISSIIIYWLQLSSFSLSPLQLQYIRNSDFVWIYKKDLLILKKKLIVKQYFLLSKANICNTYACKSWFC